MYNDRDVTMEGRGQPRIRPGMTVYDAAGEKIGSVQEYDPRGNYLVVQKGLFFPKDIYIPADAITRTDADNIYVNVYKDTLNDDRYSTAPTAEAGTALDADLDTVTTRRSRVTDDEASPRMRTTSDRAGTGDQPGASREGDIAVPVHEEELVAGKRREQTGQVHVHKDVVAEQQSVSIPVSHEEVQVERFPVDKELPADQLGADAWQEKDIDVPLMGEEVVTEKRPHVAEEVHLHKQGVTENQRVSDTVRKERVQVDGVDDQGRPLNADSDGETTRRPRTR